MSEFFAVIKTIFSNASALNPVSNGFIVPLIRIIKGTLQIREINLRINDSNLLQVNKKDSWDTLLLILIKTKHRLDCVFAGEFEHWLSYSFKVPQTWISAKSVCWRVWRKANNNLYAKSFTFTQKPLAPRLCFGVCKRSILYCLSVDNNHSLIIFLKWQRHIFAIWNFSQSSSLIFVQVSGEGRAFKHVTKGQ